MRTLRPESHEISETTYISGETDFFSKQLINFVFQKCSVIEIWSFQCYTSLHLRLRAIFSSITLRDAQTKIWRREGGLEKADISVHAPKGKRDPTWFPVLILILTHFHPFVFLSDDLL